MPKIPRERGLSDEDITAQRAREGALLRRYREARGLTLDAFAAALNEEIGLGTTYARPKIKEFEGGVRPIPDVLLQHIKARDTPDLIAIINLLELCLPHEAAEKAVTAAARGAAIEWARSKGLFVSVDTERAHHGGDVLVIDPSGERQHLAEQLQSVIYGAIDRRVDELMSED